MNKENHEINRLFALLYAVIFGKELYASLFSGITAEEWEDVRYLAERQGVSAIVFKGIEKHEADDTYYGYADGLIGR